MPRHRLMIWSHLLKACRHGLLQVFLVGVVAPAGLQTQAEQLEQKTAFGVRVSHYEYIRLPDRRVFNALKKLF